jgi:putative ATPase
MTNSKSPLASLMRPATLTDFVGQNNLMAAGKPLREALEQGKVYSMIFWGPPGVGKTTLARLIANTNQRSFYEVSAVAAGKNDLKAIIASERKNRTDLEAMVYGAPVIFLDEIHRFNKAQQDFLLPYVESGEIVLIGATTENPSFTINNALLSRCRVYTFASLSASELEQVLNTTLNYYKKINKKTKIEAKAKSWLIAYADGDARRLLNLLEQTWDTFGNFQLKNLQASCQNTLRYDRDGEEHYNTISAFIKSMRASQADAALYYLARMIKNGEQAEYIARRMIVFASEDIGLAVPTALVVANQVYQAVTNIGLPEAQINLAHGVAYLALCKKSRRSYDGYFAALADVEETKNLEIPLFLRNAPTKLMKELGYHRGYEMYNNSGQSYLPEELKHKTYLPPLKK